MHGDERCAEAWSNDYDELHAWSDAEKGEDEGGVLESTGKEVTLTAPVIGRKGWKLDSAYEFWRCG